MIQSIQYRKSSFLGSPEWLTLPWSETGKDIYQQLYDKGFALAALLEQMDNAELTNENMNTSTLSDFLERLSALDEEMIIWYREMLKESPSPLYRHAQSVAHGGRPKEAECPLPPFLFSTLLFANTMITYWALRLVLSNAIAVACEHLLSVNTQVPAQSPFFTSQQQNQYLYTARRLLEMHNSSYHLELATNIIRSMPYCLNDNMGLMSAQKSLFALRVALFVFQHHPGEYLKWCQTLYQQLDSEKGLKYAREIAKVEGKFSAPSTDRPPRT